MRTLLALPTVTVIHEAGLTRNWDIAYDYETIKLRSVLIILPVTRQGVV